jgi:hypothetical protein
VAATTRTSARLVARKYSDLQVEASLQLSIYSYATAMNGLADQEDLRLRFDVLTKTKTPELHRYRTTRDRGPTSASTASRRRSWVPSTPASSRRGLAGTAETARCGAGAGRGGERTRPPRRQGPSKLIRSRSPCIPSGTGSRVGRVTGPLGNRASAWACGLARRRGTGPALPRGHASGLVSAGDLSTPPARADRALPGDRDAPPDVTVVLDRRQSERRVREMQNAPTAEERRQWSDRRTPQTAGDRSIWTHRGFQAHPDPWLD